MVDVLDLSLFVVCRYMHDVCDFCLSVESVTVLFVSHTLISHPSSMSVFFVVVWISCYCCMRCLCAVCFKCLCVCIVCFGLCYCCFIVCGCRVLMNV